MISTVGDVMTDAASLPEQESVNVWARQTVSAYSPSLAIVIPVYKHSVLVAEAITCAIREAEATSGIVVIVNDGCPYVETHEVCSHFAKSHPGVVDYIRTPNGGLSTARNRGIRHALKRFNGMRYVYLLDADNRIDAGAMRRVTKLMEDTGADWVYPNIDKFGMEWSGDYSAPYSVLRHLFQNICEAGSLIHRRVFDRGVFFDETMQKGYEDWEFWLQCASAGFRGVPCPDFGFHYRARRESMVRDSGRSDAEILAYMHQKHKQLYSWKNILRLEHLEAPRFCVVNPISQTYAFTSVPNNSSRTRDLVDIDRDFWWSIASPVDLHFPSFIVVASGNVIEELSRLRLVDWVFWQIEDLLESASFVVLTLDSSDDTLSASIRSSPDPLPAGKPSLIATTRECLQACGLDSGTAWIDSLRTERPDPAVNYIDIEGPIWAGLGEIDTSAMLDGLFAVLAQLRGSTFALSNLENWEWRKQDALIASSKLFLQTRSHMGAFAPLGRCSVNDEREIAFIVPVMYFGGVEQVAIQLARQFKRAGWSTRLVLTTSNQIDAPQRIWEVFDSCLFLNDPGHVSWNPSGYKYYGHDLQKWASEGRIDRLTGLLAGCAAVCNFQAMHSNEVMGWMRRQSVVTLTSLHLIDRDRLGAPEGHPYWMLAYEHAYDLITTPSLHLRDFCSASGVPREKLAMLSNAPTFELTDDIISVISAKLDQLSYEAAQPGSERPLRILSLGRLDRQKGIDRLAAVIKMTGVQHLPVEWRLVGSRVMVEDKSSYRLAEMPGVETYPAVYERSAVIEHLLWADAVVLFSHWEGSPLSILEAQALGVIPVATDVGAVSEMINSGKDGIIIPDQSRDKTVIKAIESIRSLFLPSFRLSLSRAAMQRAGSLSWFQTSCEVVSRVTSLVDQSSRKI